jgi:hypothetical protein
LVATVANLSSAAIHTLTIDNPLSGYFTGDGSGLTNLTGVSGSGIQNSTNSVFNVKELGAIGNGTADDTAAFELALRMAKTNGGGIVFAPAGTYSIIRTLYLPSSVELRGSGNSTRITKPASVKCFLTNNPSVGYSVTLSNITGFGLSNSIYMADTGYFESWATRAVITNISGNTLTFNKIMPHGYTTANGSFATTSFSLLQNESDGQTNVVIRDLTLDHARGNSTDQTNDYTVGTIYYEGMIGAIVDNVTILNAESDAYSDQATNSAIFVPGTNTMRHTANTIKNSRILNAMRHGVHLGTGMDGAFVINNRIENCGGFAEFYCANVCYTLSSGNIVRNCGSGFAGIDFRDFGNIVSGNDIRGCTTWSIDTSSSGADGTGGRLSIVNNIMEGVGMSLAQPDCTVMGNTFYLTNSKTGILLSAFADRDLIIGNVFFTLGAGLGIQSSGGADDLRVIGNNFNGFSQLGSFGGCSRLLLSENVNSGITGFTWLFEGAACTNVIIRDEWYNTTTPVYESTPIVRLLFNSLGENSTTNPAVGGQWNVTGRMYDGAIVHWTDDIGNSQYSLFRTNGWTQLSTKDASGSIRVSNGTFSGTATVSNLTATVANLSSAAIHTLTIDNPLSGYFTGDGNGLTNLNLTNKVISGATFSGVSTNLASAYHTGGRLESNLVTGNWNNASNGVITLGPTNAAATITLNGPSGVITATTFSGAGTSLTGTAASLSIGGNAVTATAATYVSTGTLTNQYYGTNGVDRAIHNTNNYNGVVLDSTKQYQQFVTNATLTVSGFSGLVSGAQHIFSITYSNSSASAIIWNGPPTAKYFGTASTNALSIPAGKEAVCSFWILPNVRTNICNIGEQ